MISMAEEFDPDQYGSASESDEEKRKAQYNRRKHRVENAKYVPSIQKLTDEEYD